jgi:hypothetical protein
MLSIASGVFFTTQTRCGLKCGIVGPECHRFCIGINRLIVFCGGEGGSQDERRPLRAERSRLSRQYWVVPSSRTSNLAPKQSASLMCSILFRFAYHGRRRRVLELEPVRRPARPVARLEDSQAALIAAHDLAIDQARPKYKVVHGPRPRTEPSRIAVHLASRLEPAAMRAIRTGRMLLGVQR